MKTARRMVLVAGLAALALGGLSLRLLTRPVRPDIVLITIDALRPDHLACYGYGRDTAPFLDSLARDGTIFTMCRSAADWTAPALASMLCSVYPRSHGVLKGVARDREIHGQEILSDSFVTLAETLKASGYATFAVAGTGHASKQTGMAQGFDEFVSLWFPQSGVLHAELLKLKDRLKSSRPFFLWIHYFNPHAPYVAREPWIGQYATQPELIALLENKQVEQLKEIVPRMAEHPELRQAFFDLYDSNINYVDDFVRLLFAEVLPARRRAVLVSADHGESFAEHGFLGHAQSLFEEEIRIPLIVVPPDGAPKSRRVAAPVTILDFYPTIVEFAGGKAPPGIEGRSLIGMMNGAPAESGRPIFCEFDRGAPQKAVIVDNWKLIANAGNPGADMLFDLASDPNEKTNLAAAATEPARALREKLSDWEARRPRFDAPRGAVRLTPEQEASLRSLGYLR